MSLGFEETLPTVFPVFVFSRGQQFARRSAFVPGQQFRNHRLQTRTTARIVGRRGLVQFVAGLQ